MSDDEQTKTAIENTEDTDADNAKMDQYPIVKRKTLDLTEKSEGITIEVCNPVTRDEKLTKHTVYTIRGSDKEGAFETIRRYSDFDKIRALLVLRWPGLYIPPLPPKNTMNKMDAKFIEERKRALDHFCKSIGGIPHLHYSEEFQLFIRSSTPDVEKSIQIFQKINYEDIIAKYSKNYSHLSGRDLTNETVLRISGFKLFLTKVRGQFENYKKISRNVANAKRAYYSQLSTFHEKTMVPYETSVFCEYHGKKEGRNVFSEATSEKMTEAGERLKMLGERGSYEYINEWMEAEARDIDAFLEALNQREKYDTLKIKTQEKEKSETEDLHKIVAGKKTLKSMFTKKNKEEEVQEQEKTIAGIRKTLEELTSLYDMMTLIIAYEEIDKFKNRRINGYYKVLGAGAGNEFKNLGDLSTYWGSLLASENIKSL